MKNFFEYELVITETIISNSPPTINSDFDISEDVSNNFYLELYKKLSLA